MTRDLSTLEWKEVQDWLQNNNMEKYIKHFQSFYVNGYDLCYLANEDFSEMSITNFHDKNIILRNIRMMTLEELKLNMQYEGKRITIQLDFEPSFTAEMLAMSLCDLFHIQNKIYLSTADGEILMPNIKIVELILLNPKKYKQLKILSEKDNYSIPMNSNMNMSSAYGSNPNIIANQPKCYEEPSKIQMKINENDYRQKGLKDHYSLFEPPKKFEKNDIEKEYMLYKESKGTIAQNQNMSSNSNMNNSMSNDQAQYSKDPIISQIKLDQYKNFKDKEFQRPYTPIEKQRFNPNLKDKEQSQPSGYSSKNFNQNDSNSKQNPGMSEAIQNDSSFNYNNNNNGEFYAYDNAPKSNINNDFRLPLPLDDIKKEQAYGNYNMNINNQSSLQQNRFKEDPKKYGSEKRSFRNSDPNANENELLMKQSDKFNNFNERPTNEDQYNRKQSKEMGMDQMNVTQTPFDTKLKMRPMPMRANYEFDSSSVSLKPKQTFGVQYGDRDRK